MSIIVDFERSPATRILEAFAHFGVARSGLSSYETERGFALIVGLVPALVELRDDGKLEFDPEVFDELMSMEALIELVVSDDVGLSAPARDSVRRYLESLPSFDARFMSYHPATAEQFAAQSASANRILQTVFATGTSH